MKYVYGLGLFLLLVLLVSCATESANNFEDGGNEQVIIIGGEDTIQSNQELCEFYGGLWNSDYDECTNIASDDCIAIGGTFNECASPCRHDEDENAPCILMCLQLCTFDEQNIIPDQQELNFCNDDADCVNLCSGCYNVENAPGIDCAGLPVGTCTCEEKLCTHKG